MRLTTLLCCLLTTIALAACHEESSSCYSPSQNLDRAYAPDAVGCACSASDKDQCIEGVALVCENGRWEAYVDGPCQPQWPACGAGETRDASGRCVQNAARCASQRVLMDSDLPRASGSPHYWVNGRCLEWAYGCVGPDCGSSFDSLEQCESAHEDCPTAKPCGGRRGDTCDENEFCAYYGGDCGLADGEATCQPRPTACEDADAPVCGCNGETYANACEANYAGQGVYKLAACP